MICTEGEAVKVLLLAMSGGYLRYNFKGAAQNWTKLGRFVTDKSHGAERWQCDTEHDSHFSLIPHSQ